MYFRRSLSLNRLFSILLAALILSIAMPSAQALAEHAAPGVTVSLTPPVAGVKPESSIRRLVPEPGIFVLIAAAGFLFIIRRRV